MRLHTDTVRKIRQYARQGYTNTEIAEAFGTSHTTVWRIVNRKAYARVKDDDDIRSLVVVQPGQTRDTPATRAKRQRVEAQEAEQQRLEDERVERQRVEAEESEQQRLEDERVERQRVEAEEAEQQRLEDERVERQRVEAEESEQQRLEDERVERQRVEAEESEQQRLEDEEPERQRVEAQEARERADAANARHRAKWGIPEPTKSPRAEKQIERDRALVQSAQTESATERKYNAGVARYQGPAPPAKISWWEAVFLTAHQLASASRASDPARSES